MTHANTVCLGTAFDQLYDRYNRRQFVHPDPLEFLYCYDLAEEREIVGLVASSLAYGRVGGILASVSAVLKAMQPSPRRFACGNSLKRIRQNFSRFKHRFTTGEDLARLLWAAGRLIERHGSLEGCFISGLSDSDETVVPALSRFVRGIEHEAGAPLRFLLPRPERGSACKRLNLFLRWMVRRDEVDPGGWQGLSPAKLVVPLDTHMHRICLALGLTSRKRADLKAALEVTAAFRRIAPHDPVRYDFALTRLGIREAMDARDIAALRLQGGWN